jgi:hypothetical protein
MSRYSIGLCVCLLTVAALQSQEPAPKNNTLESLREQLIAAQKEPEKKLQKEEKPAPPQDVFAEPSTEVARSDPGLNSHMIGDLMGSFATITVKVPAVVLDSEGQFFNVTGTRKIRVPIGGCGGFKIGENESILPGDRAFFTYNYFNDVQGPTQGNNKPEVQQGTIDGFPFPVTVLAAGVATPRADIHRETIGFEKSFCDDRFSIGLRVPFFQENGIAAVEAAGLSTRDLGDLTMIFKYAPWRDPATGYGTAIGVAVTLPTGPDVPTPIGNIHPAIVQPFVGYQLGMESFLVYGFASVAVPTNDHDVTLLFNDIGLGYRLWEGDGFIRSVVPVVEGHLTTPLDHRHASDVIQGIDLFAVTGGVHVGLGERSLLTLGVATPVTGPRPYNIEAIVQLNVRF